ncbi:MAG: helix-turn-helix domain-containing protein [Firmicutes bacterium]|nr:helix-turn-helix domain-containing protein [Bacillota bacterium]
MKTKVINNTITYLLNFEKYSSFVQALEETAISNDFQVVLLSDDFNPLITVETRHQITVDEAVRVGRELAYGAADTYRLVEIGGLKTYWGTVSLESGKYYLLIVDNEGKYANEEINMLGDIIQLSMGMWKYQPERDAKAEFVRALIRGNKSLAYSLRDEADIDPQDILSVFYLKGYDQDVIEKAYADFEKRSNLCVVKIDEENGTHGLILRGKSHEVRESDIGIEQCIALFDKLKEDKKVRIFHVTGLDGVEGAVDGMRLITETGTFVEKVFPYKRVFSKYELVLVMNCIFIQVNGGQLKKSFTDLLEPFRKEGSNKAKQLLNTLETFVLDAGMNSAKTSDFLEVHTNTVQYRLKKINEILGAELTGNRVIPGLTIALALRRMESKKK